jgi:hypothetical protein
VLTSSQRLFQSEWVPFKVKRAFSGHICLEGYMPLGLDVLVTHPLLLTASGDCFSIWLFKLSFKINVLKLQKASVLKEQQTDER